MQNEAFPRAVSPMLARTARKPFDSPDFIYELKWDGMRAIAFVEGDNVKLQSRNLRNVTSQFPEIQELPKALKVDRAILDGELVCFDQDGHPSLTRLQQRLNRISRGSIDRGPRATFVVFDILWADDESLMNEPLVSRKNRLHDVLKPGGVAQPCEFMESDGVAFYEAAAKMGLEGIMAKDRGSKYLPGRRSDGWLKIKRMREADLVIGGYDFSGKRSLFSSLIVGMYDNNGDLIHIGNVGTGFSQAEQRRIYAELEGRHIERSPFADESDIQGFVHWCEPELVCTVRYGEITERGRLRYPSFIAMRTDKPPEDCRLEDAPGWPKGLVTV